MIGIKIKVLNSLKMMILESQNKMMIIVNLYLKIKILLIWLSNEILKMIKIKSKKI
jgi:hypothetical protein